MFTDARSPMARFPGLFLATFTLLLAASVRAEPVLPLETWQTDNGAKVLFYASDSLPMVDARITFDAGSARDPAEKGGTASLTADLLEEGTTERGAKAIADGFARVGAQFSASASLESATVQLRSLNQPDWLWPAVELAGEVVAHPAFDAADFERERDRQLRGIESRQQSASAVAQDTLRKAAFGDHPYAHPTDGSIDSVKRIEHADVRDFHARHYVARNATVVIVGDLDQADAQRLAETLTAGLPAGKPAVPLPEVPAIGASRTLHVDFPSEQSTVLVAHEGIPRKDEDYLALYVGNHILGGSGFASRLMSELREKRGLAYSTYSYLVPLRAGGRFVMGIQTRNDQVEKALDLMAGELQRFIEEGPTDEELEDSQANLIGGFPMRLNSNAKLSEQIGALALFELPLDYFDTYTQRVDAVKADAVRQAFARHVDPERRIVVIVGPKADQDG
ncbi:pitrilysin family protein [Guyparkeria sp. 1SP6A2]|nr:pitrilysin family protein [Guyparkeria sp. 1SP6A2]